MTLSLYRGPWPKNVSRLAKYSVRQQSGTWQVTVLYEVENGLRYLAVDGGATDLAAMVNRVKQAAGEGAGGTFYVNEYRHVIVPVKHREWGTVYYGAGRFEGDMQFSFEDHPLSTKPVDEEGNPLAPGQRWVGPRPGIPYVLTAGCKDIYYTRPGLTDEEPPRVRTSTKQRVSLLKTIGSGGGLGQTLYAVAEQRGSAGGRFYVNEHGAIFTPMDAGDGNGLNYVFCGLLDKRAWFPEPPLGV